MKYDLNLRDYWRTIRKRKFIIIFTVICMSFFSLFWSIVGKPTPLYRTSTSIKIERSSSLAGLFTQTLSWSPTNYLETQSSIIKSYILLEAVAKRLGLIPKDLPPEHVRSNSHYVSVVMDLKRMVETEQEGNTDIINIIVTSEDPKFAQRLANTIAQVYIEEHILDLNRRTFEAKKFLEGQLKAVKEKTDRSEENVREYREQHNLVSLDAQSSALLAQAAKLQAALEQDMLTLQKVNEISHNLSHADERSLTSKTVFYIGDAPIVYKGLNDRLLNLIMERDTLLRTYTENFPQVQEINAQIHETINTMKSQLASRKKQLEGNIKLLQAQLKEIDDKIKKIPEKGLELARLEREVTLNREIYTLLEKKYQEALIQEAEKIEEVRIVKPALEPTQAINPPKTATNTFVGTLMGLILGIVIAFIIETFDTSIGAIEEVEEFLGVKVLGIIPFVHTEEIRKTLEEKSKETVDEEKIRKVARLISHFLPTSTTAENYRALRTNFNFINLDNAIKSIVFTSSSPEEGKTTIAVNLAITMAQSGKKVLFVEGDLRRPIIARIFGIDSVPGLTDVILGNNEWRSVVRGITDLITGRMTIDEVMQTPGLDNLYIIPGGEKAPNPAELITSKAVKSFLIEARAEFDIILIDAPPILAATDAALWSSLSDGALIVYQVGRIARGALKRAKAQLDYSGAKIVGVVLNGLKAEISPDFAYHDKYYYYGDTSRRKPDLKEKIISFPGRVPEYLKEVVTKLFESSRTRVKGKISRLNVSIPLFLALSFLGLGILFQAGRLGPHDIRSITHTRESMEKHVQPPSSLSTEQQPVSMIATDHQGHHVMMSTSGDWGTIYVARARINIRKQRSIHSPIVGRLQPGQRVKADFLKDDWYAVFKISESRRDESLALGYVHAPLLISR